MSTRSGKRIHSCLHENTVNSDVELVSKHGKNTRRRHMKENIEATNIGLQNFKKRENYVSYPTDDEQVGDATNSNENESKDTRMLRKNALKELNPTIPTTESSDSEKAPKTIRSTRRTRIHADVVAEGTEKEIQENESDAIERKTRKSKRKIISSESAEGDLKTIKKRNKKKKGKRSNSLINENVVEEIVVENKGNVSNDSFHSAAGSPLYKDVKTSQEEAQQNSDEVVQPRKSNRKVKKHVSECKSISNLISEDQDLSEKHNGTFEIEKPRDILSIDTGTHLAVGNVTKIRKSDVNISLSTEVDVCNNKNDTFDLQQKTSNKRKLSVNKSGLVYDVEFAPRVRQSDENVGIATDRNINGTFDIEQSNDYKNESLTNIINKTFEKENVCATFESYKRKSTTENLDINRSADTPTYKKPSLNSTYDKINTSLKLNSSFENEYFNSSTAKRKSTVDTTFEKESKSPKTNIRMSRISFNMGRKSTESIKSSSMVCFDMTSELANEVSNLNTLDKSEKNNSSFDKEPNLNYTFEKLSKSLISSDSNNEDMSRISITSDESTAEQQIELPKKIVTIMNTTPVLVDSSIDDHDSFIVEESKSVATLLKREGTFSLEDTINTVPLKREGTFTKDGPDDPSMNKELSPTTPNKKISLRSPGCTPHPNSSIAKRSMLNVTRSIEKRQSTLGPAPRTTRVMFCSPVNTPVVVAQQKRTVIKSNLKGSNKSFVYEEIADSPVRPATGRKRALTHSETDGARLKRTRLAASPTHSPHRTTHGQLRSRTSSANAKLIDSTPSKKSTTPTKAKVPRTKLPNFAAMHQKQFDKMESLDECQERKAKRARQLLTPTSGLNLPEKSSPKVTDSPRHPPKEVKKVDPLTKSFNQEASKPAYTRFGFKLNLDVNPFSIPTKNPVKVNPNGLKRQATLPSLAGATSARREVAKQVVMREKSFSDKRLLKRNENRTIIKGVRTNRRFELQMKLRNIE